LGHIKTGLNDNQFDHFMDLAIGLAQKVQWGTEPNPRVGALLVDIQGNIIGEGFHKKSGEAHAEVLALQKYSTVPSGSTLFVTLEPCVHKGLTPPCTKLLIQKGVETVVIGATDPNPVVSGKGIEELRQNGVHVISGIREKECLKINMIFNKHILTGLPFISIKSAITLDGKIATAKGESQWITGPDARAKGHNLRSIHQAIAIGTGTLISDNPELTDRSSEYPRDPVRIIFSSKGQIDLNSRFVQSKHSRQILVTGSRIESEQREKLEDSGVELLVSDEERPPVPWVLKQLYTKGICSVLVEGGALLSSSFIRENLVDRLYLFVSGKIIGDPGAPSWCGPLGISQLQNAPEFKIDETEKIGMDLLITCLRNSTLDQ